MARSEDSKKTSLSRRAVIKCGLAAAGAAFLARPFLLAGEGRAVAEDQWYEVVQDMWQADRWHVNLYAGPVRGDLARGRLVTRWTKASASPLAVKQVLEHPWRVQYRDGPQEQSF